MFPIDSAAHARWPLRRADLFILLVLLLAGIKFTFGISRVLDVALFDESAYLHSGTALRHVGLPEAESGPLYALWYYLLSLAQPDPVRLYYLNIVLTTILPPVALYVVLRINRVSLVTAALICAYFLITQANFVTWPRPSHFALLVVMVFLAAAARVRRPSSSVLLTAIGALVAAFARPEYFLAFLLLMAGGLGIAVAELRREKQVSAWLPAAAAILAAAALLGYFGLPAFGKGGGERHFYAFAQHFALHWANWTNLPVDDPYNPGDNFREIAARYFGNAHTVLQAFRNNPHAFAHHILTNSRTLITRFPGVFLHHQPIFLPPGKPGENMEARLALLGLVVLLYVRREIWWPFARENFLRHRRLLACLAVLCVPGFISCVEIFTHDHYMLLPGTLVIVAVAILLKGRDDETEAVRNPAPAYIFLLGLGILAVCPALCRGPSIDTPIARTIRCIQALGIRAPVRILDAEGGYNFYQGDNYFRVADSDKKVPFDQFLAADKINMIVWTERLDHDSRYIDDPAWHQFVAHYQGAGFEARPVPGGGATLLVQRQLLQPAQGAGHSGTVAEGLAASPR